MKNTKKQKIVIAGGGTAGWMTAAALANRLPAAAYEIVLVESEQIGTVGVGESTIPHIRQFNQALNIDEAEFIQATNATIKLGIRFNDWGNIGDSYMHPFGELGRTTNGIDFHHYWLKNRVNGDTSSIDSYSVAAVAAHKGRFALPVNKRESLLSTYVYSYHIDAGAYASYLRKYAEQKSVARIEGTITRVLQCQQTQNIRALELNHGQQIEGNWFIDCSGFNALLIGKTLKSPFTDWSHYLPTDTAVVVASEKHGTTHPYTLASAKPAGWQWQIPLQHRIGNGHVFSSQFMDRQQAQDILLKNLPSTPIAEPRTLTFTAGYRAQMWRNNCVAIGLSSGFLEPLESTSIYLIQMGIAKFLEFLPTTATAEVCAGAFNRQLSYFYHQIRNFIILHYRLTSRDDSEFWRYCRTMAIPPELEQLIGQFAECGLIDKTQYGVWPAVCIGQGLIPKHFDSRLNYFDDSQIAGYLSNYRQQVDTASKQLPLVDEYLTALNRPPHDSMVMI